VPIVSIGGQETQLFLSRGTWLAKRLGLKQRLRNEMAPISFGFPFGLSLGGINLPMPAKLITQVMPPIDIRARFGDRPDVDAVDIHIRE
jgi:hypothetical protein